ncbi:hypothetical protein CIB84_009412 [Bambusicola thoracicus]|uniref:Uncharacterized protein n=1 Tax=Bambusicola thoracicus TaxID=9083 RepID=A0A2P4SRU5_BAMTH|nr:hypothetical protein CIB84_009412 [Bambusicola thoracicus]
MFMELLADEKSMQDDRDPDIIMSEAFQKLESENPSQKNSEESAVQSQWSPGISHGVSPFTEASQDEYNCSTTSRKSAQSEESFESGYRSSSTNSASLDARDSPCKLQQSLLPWSSESQHNPSALIWESLNKPAFDRISSPAYKSSDTLISPSVEPCGSAYKSFHAVMSPSVEPCGSAYKSLATLMSPSVEPCSSAYKSFDALMSQSVANSSLNMDFENMCLLPSLTQSSEAHANNGVPAFLPEEKMCKQAVYQNLQKEGSVLSCPAGPQPSGYKPFDAAVKCSAARFDGSSEVISKSLYEPLVHILYNNLEETSPDNITRGPDQKVDGRECLTVQDLDSGIAPGVGSSEKVTHSSSDDSLLIVSSHELLSDTKDENISRDKQLLHFSELSCQDFNGERAIKETEHNDFNCCGEGVQGSSSDGINTDFQRAPHNHLRKFGNAEENKEVANRGCSCSAANLLEPSLDSIGLTLKTAEEPLELLVSDKLSAALFVDNPHLSDSHTTPSDNSGLAPAVKKRPSELLRENNRKKEKKVELLQALAQEDSCYMKVV